jgi:hypothetical protein
MSAKHQSPSDVEPAGPHVLTIRSLLHHRYDHQERLSAKEAMAHAYFAPVREAAARGASQGAGSGYAV